MRHSVVQSRNVNCHGLPIDRYTYDIDSRRPVVVVVVVQGQARHSIRTDDDSRVMSVCLCPCHITCAIEVSQINQSLSFQKYRILSDSGDEG